MVDSTLKLYTGLHSHSQQYVTGNPGPVTEILAPQITGIL